MAIAMNMITQYSLRGVSRLLSTSVLICAQAMSSRISFPIFFSLYSLDVALANPLQIHHRWKRTEFFKNAVTTQLVTRLFIFLLFIFNQVNLLLLPLPSHSGFRIKQIAEGNGAGRASLLAGSLHIAIMYLAPLGLRIIAGGISALLAECTFLHHALGAHGQIRVKLHLHRLGPGVFLLGIVVPVEITHLVRTVGFA